MYWTLKDGLLQVTEHYNPSERIVQVAEETMKDYIDIIKTDLYTTDSNKVQTIAPGEGVVGKVYSSKDNVFFEDIANLPADEYLRCYGVEFAKKYGIKSMAVMPYEGGVLEIGMTRDTVFECCAEAPSC